MVMRIANKETKGNDKNDVSRLDHWRKGGGCCQVGYMFFEAIEQNTMGRQSY